MTNIYGFIYLFAEELLRSSLEKPHTLTLALSHQGRGDLRIAPPLTGGPSIGKTEVDKGEGV
jgi:hypothetical protein